MGVQVQVDSDKETQDNEPVKEMKKNALKSDTKQKQNNSSENVRSKEKEKKKENAKQSNSYCKRIGNDYSTDSEDDSCYLAHNVDKAAKEEKKIKVFKDSKPLKLQNSSSFSDKENKSSISRANDKVKIKTKSDSSNDSEKNRAERNVNKAHRKDKQSKQSQTNNNKGMSNKSTSKQPSMQDALKLSDDIDKTCTISDIDDKTLTSVSQLSLSSPIKTTIGEVCKSLTKIFLSLHFINERSVTNVFFINALETLALHNKG